MEVRREITMDTRKLTAAWKRLRNNAAVIRKAAVGSIANLGNNVLVLAAFASWISGSDLFALLIDTLAGGRKAAERTVSNDYYTTWPGITEVHPIVPCNPNPMPTVLRPPVRNKTRTGKSSPIQRPEPNRNFHAVGPESPGLHGRFSLDTHVHIPTGAFDGLGTCGVHVSYHFPARPSTVGD